MIEVIEYTTGMGICPYRAYVTGVKDTQAQSQIYKAINKMEAGLLKNARSLDGGLQEFKVAAGEGHRIYFYRDGQTLIVLLAGSSKKDQNREIDKARNYLEDYKRQKSTATGEEDNEKRHPNYNRSS